MRKYEATRQKYSLKKGSYTKELNSSEEEEISNTEFQK
jgi:hypothetical protein